MFAFHYSRFLLVTQIKFLEKWASVLYQWHAWWVVCLLMTNAFLVIFSSLVVEIDPYLQKICITKATKIVNTLVSNI